MKTTVGQLRRIIKEEQDLREFFSKKETLANLLDQVLQDLQDTNRKIEKAHQIAPVGPARAIVAGLHSDLFNQTAEFRKYVAQLKTMVSKATT